MKTPACSRGRDKNGVAETMPERDGQLTLWMREFVRAPQKSAAVVRGERSH